MIFLSAIGLKDQLRNNVKSAIKFAREKGDLTVRMISGDHFETAKSVAIKAGILNKEDLAEENCIMTGEKFRNLCGAVSKERNIDGEDEYVLENQNGFNEIYQNLKVLARATANDKHAFVVGLKNQNRKVSVTGDGINDIEAIEFADVGLAVGSGCSKIKDVASLILVDDDFEASLKAVMWGRNIYHNVSRFI